MMLVVTAHAKFVSSRVKINTKAQIKNDLQFMLSKIMDLITMFFLFEDILFSIIPFIFIDLSNNGFPMIEGRAMVNARARRWRVMLKRRVTLP